jgi:hypothetical protein
MLFHYAELPDDTLRKDSRLWWNLRGHGVTTTFK